MVSHLEQVEADNHVASIDLAIRAEAGAIERRTNLAERNAPLAGAVRIGVVAPCRCADLAGFDFPITDAGIEEVIAGEIRSAAVGIVIA